MKWTTLRQLFCKFDTANLSVQKSKQNMKNNIFRNIAAIENLKHTIVKTSIVKIYCIKSINKKLF